MKTVRTRAIALVGATLLASTALVACSGGSEKAFCDFINDDKYSDIDPYTDPDAALKVLKDLKGKAPSEIKDDLQIIIDFYKAVDGKWDDPGALKKAADKVGGEDKFLAANDAVGKVADNCDAPSDK
jgi:hypothetical protein